MNNEQRLLSLLGLARRAGKLALGNTPVLEALQSGRVRLVLLAADLSPRTAGGVKRAAQETGAVVAGLTAPMEEISRALGRQTGVVAVLDEGFAKKLRALAQAASAAGADE